MKLPILALLLMLWPSVTQAQDYGAPDLSAYFRSLMMPDQPSRSCCGEADAYFADETEACRPSDGESCALVAIVTDTRPDAPRGRRHIAPGTRYAVPQSKVRRVPIPNPTDRNLLFVAPADNVLCWEPVSGL